MLGRGAQQNVRGGRFAVSCSFFDGCVLFGGYRGAILQWNFSDYKVTPSFCTETCFVPPLACLHSFDFFTFYFSSYARVSAFGALNPLGLFEKALSWVPRADSEVL